MREKKIYMVLTFKTTAEAMAMEKFCIAENIAGRLIPTPREITAGCGIAWRMTAAEYEQSKEKLSKSKYETAAALLL